MPRYFGRGQLAECMRSGKKCFAHELVRDGRNPQLLVLPEWADPKDPLERPFRPERLEGLPRFDVSPDRVPALVPTTLAATLGESAVTLTWAQFSSGSEVMSRYEIYRSIDGAAYALLDTVTVTADLRTGVVAYGSPYADSTVPGDGVVQAYYVVGYDAAGRSATTNVDSVTGVAAGDDFVFTAAFLTGDPIFGYWNDTLYSGGTAVSSDIPGVTVEGGAVTSPSNFGVYTIDTEGMFGQQNFAAGKFPGIDGYTTVTVVELDSVYALSEATDIGDYYQWPLLTSFEDAATYTLRFE